MGRGQFSHATLVAVERSGSPFFHDVYVVDEGNLRVKKLGPEGNFILTFGRGLNKTKVGKGKSE